MSKFVKKHVHCPVETTVGIIGKKWAVLIIRDLLRGKKRFGELAESLTGISPRTLAARLEELAVSGILVKKVFPEVPPHTEYSLTKRGKDLHRIIDQMTKWGEKKNKTE